MTTTAQQVLVPTQRSRPGGCGTCGSEHITSISMVLTDGTPVEFTSCRRCETKSWSTQGEALPLPHVLQRATKHKVPRAS